MKPDHSHHHQPRRGLAIVAEPNQARDPVCGMMVPEDAPLRHVHEGKPYVFCNPTCLQRFKENPAKYLASSPAMEPMAPPPSGALYVCPMDPEVRESKPGPCPKCGMALEPALPVEA